MDQVLHNSCRYLTYTGIKSRELKYHEHWHDQGGIIHYYISIQNPTVTSDGAWIFSFKPTKNHKVHFFFKLWS